MKIEVKFFLLILILLMWWIWRQRRLLCLSKEGSKTTYEWCDVGDEFIDWIEKNPNKSVKHPEMQSILEREIKTYQNFLKYHPYCDDNGEHIENVKKCLVKKTAVL